MSDKKPAKSNQYKKRFPGKDGPKGPSDRETQINRIKAKLREIRDYKRLIAEDGLKPDEDDKILESKLIVQLLRLEKGLPAKAKPKAKPKKKHR